MTPARLLPKGVHEFQKFVYIRSWMEAEFFTSNGGQVYHKHIPNSVEGPGGQTCHSIVVTDVPRSPRTWWWVRTFEPPAHALIIEQARPSAASHSGTGFSAP